jgi:archaellin
MSRFRSYFSKNNTLIEDNRTNNSQNPVSEISYGTLENRVSRFIFDIDLQPLVDKLNSGVLNPDLIKSHKLNLTNTIRIIPELVGSRYADCETQRAASFTLELFNIEEDWDEGNGYDFVYIDEQFPSIPKQASNWFERKTSIEWSVEGAVTSGTTILDSLDFQDGSENFVTDITDYINSRIFASGVTGFTGTTFGLGIKFTDDLESGTTLQRQAVAFHVKDSPTFYEPYVETIVEDLIEDDREYFYMNKENDLYLYANAGGNSVDVTVNSVTINDYQGNEATVISGDSIQEVRSGVYKVTYSTSTELYPDQVIFNDIWNVTRNGRTKDVVQQFYLINEDQYLNFDLSRRVNFDNYFFNVIGVNNGEIIKAGDTRRVVVDVRELYPDQNNNLPLNLEYRLFVKQDVDHHIDVIPFTKLDRTIAGYEFLLDTSWLIPQDYYLEVKISDSGVYNVKKPIYFTVTSTEIV